MRGKGGNLKCPKESVRKCPGTVEKRRKGGVNSGKLLAWKGGKWLCKERSGERCEKGIGVSRDVWGSEGVRGARGGSSERRSLYL